MSIFDKLFERRPTKFDLIRNLLKARLRSDPMAQRLPESTGRS